MASPRGTQQRASSEPWQILRWRSRQMAHRELLAEGVALTMLRIPAGSFAMGAPETEADSRENERPVHRVTLRECLLGQTPITQAQWRAVAEWQRPEPDCAEEWPETLDPDPVEKLANAERLRGDQRPVVAVSWQDALAFCQRLRLRTGKHYTLPSEARWEYACRAGTTTPFHFGQTISSELANSNCTQPYANGPKGEYREQTTDVGMFRANAWGLHDMHGNVWEWCADHWHDNYIGAPANGSAWVKPDHEIRTSGLSFLLLRGGSWFDRPWYCRSAYRFRNHPGYRNRIIGFRVCCLPQD